MTTREALDGPCCFLELCCEWPRSGAALAAKHPEISTEAAKAVLDNFSLVPKSIEPGSDHLSEEHARSAKQRLERLHRRIQTELKGILLDMGHRTEKGA